MHWTHAILWAIWVATVIATFWGFIWAKRSGQFRDLDAAALLVFEDDDPGDRPDRRR